MKILAAAALLVAAPLAAQDYTLRLRPAQENLPNVMAALDPSSALDPAQQSLNPFLYECVAFLQLQSTRADTVFFTNAFVWIAPAQDLTKRRRPRLQSLRANRRTLMVTLDPGDSRLEYVVGIDSAVVADRVGADTVRDLVSEPFPIPQEELEQCGRVPGIDIELLAPDGDQPGFNVDASVWWRRPLTLAGGALLEVGVDAAATSAGESTLLNAVSLGGRFELKVNRDYRHWVSIGVSPRLEATEDFDIIDLALGASARARLDFLPLTQLRKLLRRFTPYPMVSLEYNFVDRLKGSGEPEVVGRPDTEHRLRGEFSWALPLILGTTVRARLRSDYLLSDVPAGESRFRNLCDVTLEYPITVSGDVALVVQWLEGRAAPVYELASVVLLGLGIRR